jgi:hypothetical protein
MDNSVTFWVWILTRQAIDVRVWCSDGNTRIPTDAQASSRAFCFEGVTSKVLHIFLTKKGTQHWASTTQKGGEERGSYRAVLSSSWLLRGPLDLVLKCFFPCLIEPLMQFWKQSFLLIKPLVLEISFTWPNLSKVHLPRTHLKHLCNIALV